MLSAWTNNLPERSANKIKHTTLRTFKAYMNSDVQLETAAIFFLANLYLKQGIG